MMAAILSSDKLTNAHIKNRAEASQLQTELVRLEKEKKDQLRMHNNEKQRFRARYSKNSMSLLDSSIQEAADVKMYETHNPGFCYKRNGEQRLQQVPSTNPPIDFEHLHFLLFTDGEVDIEKVLCLHLLSAHETDHLAPPNRPNRPLSNIMKRNSPLEQLLERSDEKELVLKSSKLLPTYVLDVKCDGAKSIRDFRLTSRLLINEKILELILTVITTLEDSNPEKVQLLMGIAEDPSMLKRIFRKPHIQKFVITLKAHALVSSCSSFVLTQPFKLEPSHLEIRTQNGALEELVRYIRANVLQFPKRHSDELEEKSATFVNEKIEAKSSMLLLGAKKSPEPTTKLIRLQPRAARDADQHDLAHHPNRFRRSSVNFVAKNIAAVGGGAPTSRRNSKDSRDRKRLDGGGSSTSSSRKSSFLGEKGSLLRRPSVAESATSRRSQESKDSSRKRKSMESSDSESVKYHLKQTTCPACMEKWKIPLPSPKVSHLHKMDAVNSDEERLHHRMKLKTDSVQRISNLIEREQYKLSSYDRRYSGGSNVTALTPAKRREAGANGPDDLVQLDVYDLEKIRQEIREKEAQKKLEKFLSE